MGAWFASISVNSNAAGCLSIPSLISVKLTPTSLAPLSWNTESARILWQTSRDVIAFLADEFKVDSVNRIKPGIAEATRAVLRRVPDHIFVRSIDDPDVALLVGLAREKGIVVTEMGEPSASIGL